MSLPLDAQLEAVLFWKGEPVSLKRLAEILEKDEAAIVAALADLETRIAGSGLTIVRNNDEVMLGTSKEASGLIEKLTKEELVRDLGKAGLETLSIVLYKGPIARRDIDYIRGVNSNFILRNLMIRGLVEKVENPKDQRSFLYRPTFDLLSFMGLNAIKDLPEFETVQAEIAALSETSEEKEAGEQSEEVESAAVVEDQPNPLSEDMER